MTTGGLFAIPTRCGLCEALGAPLFSVPADRRPSERAPRAVCRFCFLRIVGIAPRRRERVDAPVR